MFCKKIKVAVLMILMTCIHFSAFGISVTGDVQQISAPVGVIPDTAGVLYLFPELSAIPTDPLAVDIDVSKLPAGVFSWSTINPLADAGNLPAGTTYQSYFLSHEEPTAGLDTASGTITFDTEIVGMIISGGNSGWPSNLLSSTEALFGSPTTIYNVPASNNFWGFEPSSSGIVFDPWSLSSDRKTLTIESNITDFPDYARILVAVPIPEPETYLLVGSFVGLVLFLAARRRRRKQPRSIGLF